MADPLLFASLSNTLGPCDTALRPFTELPMPPFKSDLDRRSAASSPVGFFRSFKPLGDGRCFGRIFPLSSVISDESGASSKLIIGTVVVHFPLASIWLS